MGLQATDMRTVTRKIRALFTPWSYKSTIIAYVFLFACVMVPPLAQGEAIIPTSLSKSARGTAPEGFVENAQWSDFMNVFVPTITAHLHAPRSGWNAIWNPYVEMGRPLRPEWGFTPVYPLTWVMTQFTHDPYLLATLFSFHITFLAGLWLIGIAYERRIDPFAALVVAALAATAPYFFQLMTHYTYIAMPSCFFGVVYLLERWVRTRDIWGALGLVWMFYSYAIMGYYQEQVYGYYMLLGYVALLIWSMRTNRREQIRWVVSILGLATIAAMLLVPYMYDFAQNVRLSIRRENTFEFFRGTMNSFQSVGGLIRTFVRSVAPELVGSPSIPELPQPSVGYGQSPLIMAFLGIGLIRAWRTQWFWILCIAVLAVVNSSVSIFQFMVEHMGFNLSRAKPAFIMVIPMIIVALHGADSFFRGWQSNVATKRTGVLAAALTVFVSYIAYLALRQYFQHVPDWRVIGVNAGIAVLLWLTIWVRNRIVWLAIVGISVVGISTPYLLWNARDAVVTKTPFVDKVRLMLADGGRLGRTVNFGPALTPNSNVQFGIPTMHSLNSVLPARYAAYIDSLGGTVINHNILAKEISPDYASTAFWMSDVRVMGTILDLKAVPGLSFEHKLAGISLYRVRDSMGCCIQMMADQSDYTAPGEVTVVDPRKSGYTRLEKSLDLGDIYELPVYPDAGSVVAISQQFHPQWRVFGWKDSEWLPLKPVAVNGLFQGVELQAGVERVRFEFRPLVRYAWIAHVFFGLGLVAATVWSNWQRICSTWFVVVRRVQRAGI